MVSLEEIVALCKRRGFVYPASEIYGGLSNAYDYGPMGAELLRNIRNLWWNELISKRPDMVGLDSSIILHPRTWEASGHVASFNELRAEDVKTKKRYRVDHLIEDWISQNPGFENVVVEDMTNDEMIGFLKEHKILSPEKNELADPKPFNQLFETSIGTVSGDKSNVYLRGETAQGIFSNFKQILDSTRVKLPFGVGQIGKSFRNEITTGQFVFRTLEFEQGEIEYFFDPESSSWEDLMTAWKAQMEDFVTRVLGVNKENIRWRRHTDKERSHYSKDTYDLDYQFSFGWKELWGVAYRTNYDLKQHMEFSGESLEYTDPNSGKKFVPHVIEPAVGINRIFLMLLTDAYSKTDDGRVLLKLKANVAPYKVAVFPLLPNKPELVDKAKEIYKSLSESFATAWDDRGNIGKRYAAQDEVGTPWCVTVDFDTLEIGDVTVRDRDSATQERVSVDKLHDFIHNGLKG